MGVLACDRNGCEHIMCDRYSDEHGYICDWCFEELCERGNPYDIVGFMASRKTERPDMTPVFDQLFPISRGSPRYEGDRF